jgi:predicted Zn-dependent protease
MILQVSHSSADSDARELLPGALYPHIMCFMDATRIGSRLSIALLSLLGAALAVATTSERLPDLGDASSAIVSLEVERALGEQFLRQIRARVPTVSDPILKYYTEIQLYQLAQHSELKTKILHPVLIDSEQLNAFAAPGGVVGINMGLYLSSKDVHEYSSVLAHELAHLSQRHFARGVEMQRRQTLPYLAAMLASIVIAATAGGDAGMAAMSATQGLAQQSQLRYSRGREQEADRIGITTLYQAGLDPHGMSRMFERMQRAYRYSRRPPEFLLTHPLTESRISDARNQSAQYPRRGYADSQHFQLMRARVMVRYASTPSDGVQQFRDLVERTNGADWAYYGLAVALGAAGSHEEALDTAKIIFPSHPRDILYIATHADLLIGAERYDEAIGLLAHQLVINPDNKPMSVLYAAALTGARRYVDAEEVLEHLTDIYRDDDDIWFELAETAGLAGNTIGVHQARAEYFALVGNYQSAIKHLEYARGLADPTNYQLNARLDQRIRDFRGELEEMRRS